VESLKVGRYGDITPYRHGRRAEIGYGRFEFSRAPASDEDCCALVDEATCSGQSSPAAAAGDDRCLTCQESRDFSGGWKPPACSHAAWA